MTCVQLALSRLHLTFCKHSSKGRSYRSCSCPLSVEGTLRDEYIRKSLDLRNWEAVTRLIRDWELLGKDEVISARLAVERFMADRKAMNLSASMLSKHRYVADEMTFASGERPIRSITIDDIRKMREKWDGASITAQKRMERGKNFQVPLRFRLDYRESGESSHPNRSTNQPLH